MATKRRAGRAAAKKRERVLVTGAAGGLGRLLCLRLHRQAEVIGVDRRPFPDRPKDVEHLRIDLRRKSAQQKVRKLRPDSIIHLGVMHDPHRHKGVEAFRFNLEGTAQMLALAEKLKVRKIVFLSTANLYGPSATSSGFLTEEAPLLGAGASPEIRDLISLDMMVQSFFWKQPATDTVILRPVHIVGPHLRNAPSTFLRKKRVPTLLGFDPMLQLIHESDVVAALIWALKPKLRGVFNIVGPGQAPLSRLLKARGAKSIPVPEPVMQAFLRRAFSTRLTQFPVNELGHIKYSALVDGSRAKEAGFVAKFSLSEALADL